VNNLHSPSDERGM